MIYVFDPKALYHIFIKVGFFFLHLQQSISHLLRTNTSMKKHRHFWSKFLLQPKNWPWHTEIHFKGLSLVFWSWTYRNLRHCFPVIAAWSCSWILSKGDQHRKQKRLLNPVFSIGHLRRMGMCNSSWFGDKFTYECSSSDALSHLQQGTALCSHPWSYFKYYLVHSFKKRLPIKPKTDHKKFIQSL